MDALKHLIDRYHEGDPMTDLETLVITARDGKAADELVTLRKQLRDAQKTAVYFAELGRGIRPSLNATRLLKNYEAALKGEL